MILNKLLIAAFFILLTTIGVFSQSIQKQPEDKILTFRFISGNDMFYIPWNDNGEELERLYTLIDEHHSEIISGSMPIYVEGYSASLPAQKENLQLAFTRSNRVKSELIIHKGLKEENFITNNYATTYQGNKDIVVITLRVPIKIEEPKAESKEKPVIKEEIIEKDKPFTIVEQPKHDPEIIAEPKRHEIEGLGIRTNLLYDIFLTPTLGVEWRINRNIGLKLDGSFAHWGNNHGKVQKLWIISPEVRWYIDNPKRFYLGVGANFGEYNIYKYMLGNLFSNDTGYQGNIYSGGITAGYQLPIYHNFSIDFNLGLGYTRYKYDTFFISKEVRVYKERDLTKNFWGPIQAGISVVWYPGINK